MKTNYPIWDIKFYWNIHINRQKAQWLEPVCYPQFYRRVCKMSLHDAIYMPRVWYKATRKNQTPIQDSVRRVQKLKEENIQILSLDKLSKLDKQKPKVYPRKKKTTLLSKFLSLFK